MSVITKIKKNDYVKTAIAIVIVVVLVLGLFVGLRLFLNTDVPIRVVESGSMSVPLNFISGPPYTLNEFLLTLEHPFDRTFDTGDIIVVQSVNPADLNVNYPNSDVIVYKNPNDPNGTPIVHRIVQRYEVNGTYYFQTKGDGNGDKWPTPVSSNEYDSNEIWHTGQGVSQHDVEGRVILRIPYFGWITLFFNNTTWGLPIVIALIIILLIIEFVLPIAKKKPAKPQETKNPDASAEPIP